MAKVHDDGIATGALLLAGGATGYATARWLVEPRRQSGEPARTIPSTVPLAPVASHALADHARSTAPGTAVHAHAVSRPVRPRGPTPVRPSPGDDAPITSPSQLDATDTPVSSPSQVDPGGSSRTATITTATGASVGPPPSARPDPSPHPTLMDPYPEPASPRPPSGTTSPSRAFDPIFVRYGGGIPVAFLRALADRESSMNPLERSGPAWGLLQVVEVVRHDFNRAHGTSYTREHLLDPTTNVAIACWLLRAIVASYQRHHGDIANLRTDWQNRRFVELVAFGWNAGYSEKGGVGKVAHYLSARGLPVTIDTVHEYASAAGASRHLTRSDKVRWCKGVAALYERERRNGQAPAISGSRNVFISMNDRDQLAIEGAGDPYALWEALRVYFRDERQRPSRKGVLGSRLWYPDTTAGEVRQLIPMWTRYLDASRKVRGLNPRPRWEDAAATLAAAAATQASSATFSGNDRFWYETRRLARDLGLARTAPTSWDMASEAVAESVQALPSRLADAGAKVVEVADDGLGAAKDAVLGEVKPILLGAGVIGGGLILAHLLRS